MSVSSRSIFSRLPIVCSISFGISLIWDIDEGEAEIIRRIYADFLRLYARATLSELAADLNVDGVVTARGASWHASTIRAILVNPVYWGEEGLPAIVDPAAFAAAQRRLDALKPGPVG